MSQFLIIWAGQLFSLLGSHLVQFALIWWLTKETGSATVLSIAMAMSVLPGIFISPFAGALVDRWSRRKVMIVADGSSALATLALALLFAMGTVQIWHVYAMLLVRAAAGAFHWPAMQASTALMVPERHLSRVAGLNQSVWGVASIVAPPAGALLLELLPMQGVLAIDVVTAIIAIAPLLFIQVPQPQRAEGEESASARPSVIADVRAGVRYVLGWPGMALLMGIGMANYLVVAPAAALTPLIVTTHFKGGAPEFAMLDAAWGIGMVAGGIVLTAWGGFRRRMVTAMAAMALMGVGLAVIGVAPAAAFPLAVGGSFFAGLMLPIMSGSIMAATQSTVPPEMLGRVLTLSMSTSSLTMPLGLVLGGPVADALGVQIWYLIAGIMTIVLGIGALFIPPVVEIEERGAPKVTAQ